MTHNADSQPLIEMRGIYKSFGGVHAVEDVSIDLLRGEVLGIVGHNGAGKSTLIKILSGALLADSGDIAIDGLAQAGRDRSECHPAVRAPARR